jgi:hypothetical protein
LDIEYYPGAKNYIQDALSCQADYKNPPLLRVRRKTIAKTIDDGTVNMAHTEVIL